MKRNPNPAADRVLTMGSGGTRIPERLLLAHARGEVLFITGAGISRQAGLPDFRGLVLEVYSQLDLPLYAELSALPPNTSSDAWKPPRTLSEKQIAEGRRFLQGDFDVVLGMLERRMDGLPSHSGRVRTEVIRSVTSIVSGGGRVPPKHASIHKAMTRLANRGESTVIVTTNFDLLLQAAARGSKPALSTYSLGAIPRPGHRTDFEGVLHIHGAVSPVKNKSTELIISDRDFGEHYLRRRTVPDFIYDAARLFHLVLVGYSANDAPMRYLLNAVAADGSRFSDLKERFAFVSIKSASDPVLVEDWLGRGITPIPYSEKNNHKELLISLEEWADLSAINGSQKRLNRTIQSISSQKRSQASESDRDLFDHLIRRATSAERSNIVLELNKSKADVSWLTAISSVVREPLQGTRR